MYADAVLTGGTAGPDRLPGYAGDLVTGGEPRGDPACGWKAGGSGTDGPCNLDVNEVKVSDEDGYLSQSEEVNWTANCRRKNRSWSGRTRSVARGAHDYTREKGGVAPRAPSPTERCHHVTSC